MGNVSPEKSISHAKADDPVRPVAGVDIQVARNVLAYNMKR